MTSVARMMPSGSEWRQPYTLSNFDLVTQSLTLIAGKSSVALVGHRMRRCTPVVVSSDTPTMSFTILLKRSCRLAIEALIVDEHALELGVVRRVRVRQRAVLGVRVLELLALVQEQGRVASVVDDLLGALAVRPGERLLRAPPVLLERLALPGEDVGRAGAHDRRGGVVLRREDVARAPAHVGAERLERLDQHGGLDRHVQRAHDANARERLRRAELRARGHQARHLVLGKVELLATEVGERHVGDLVVTRSLDILLDHG